jgi:hypothetical protein
MFGTDFQLFIKKRKKSVICTSFASKFFEKLAKKQIFATEF